MKWSKLALAWIPLMAAVASGSAWAGHTHFGVAIGIPLGGPLWYPPYHASPYYYPPYYYYPQSVVTGAPPEYIQQEPPQQQVAAAQYWHYCRKPDGYYPYVRQCPGGWERVPVQPPDLPSR